MNTQEYISSGILELYVLGGLSERERIQVENLALKYPEVKLELENISKTLELYAHAHSVNVPDRVKEKIFKEITILDAKYTIEKKDRKKVKFYQYVAMAASVIAIVSINAALVYYSKWNSAKEKIFILERDKIILANINKVNDTFIKEAKQYISIIQDTATILVRLKGTKNHPDAYAHLLWHKSSGRVYVSSYHLPKIPKNKGYQLWAIVDGKPQDAGMLCRIKQSGKLCTMKSFTRANAFAITIERKEGSTMPTLDNLVVIKSL